MKRQRKSREEKEDAEPAAPPAKAAKVASAPRPRGVVKKHHCLYDKCGRVFSKKSNLVAHEKAVHYTQKPFQCEFPGCGRSFGFKHVFQKHYQTVHVDGKVGGPPEWSSKDTLVIEKSGAHLISSPRVLICFAFFFFLPSVVAAARLPRAVPPQGPVCEEEGR